MNGGFVGWMRPCFRLSVHDNIFDSGECLHIFHLLSFHSMQAGGRERLWKKKFNLLLSYTHSSYIIYIFFSFARCPFNPLQVDQQTQCSKSHTKKQIIHQPNISGTNSFPNNTIAVRICTYDTLVERKNE